NHEHLLGGRRLDLHAPAGLKRRISHKNCNDVRHGVYRGRRQTRGRYHRGKPHANFTCSHDLFEILLNNAPKILCDDVSNAADAKKALSEFVTNATMQLSLLDLRNYEECGLPDYLALQELIQARHSVSNFELIVVTTAKDYYSISESFLLPCLVRFVIIGDEAKSSGRMLADFLAITSQCVTNTGISKDAAEQWNLAPSFMQDAKTATQTAKRLASEKRTHHVAKFNLSSLVSLDVRLTPGVPKTPIAIIGSEVVQKHIAPDQPPTFDLLGFVKLTMLPNIPSSTLMHLATVPDDADEQLRTTFHLMAESLGSEGNVAVFQHSSGEECFLKPVRYDVNEPWKLVLLWIDSSSFKWHLASGPVEKPSTSLAEEYGLSYKVSASRTYWTDSHGIQSDIIKLARSLRRVDRLDQFYSVMNTYVD
ncbi:hypothetical protein AAVH_40597, partial [Aphelenchoides avenae]